MPLVRVTGPAEPDRSGHVINVQNNPNMTSPDWNFPDDPTFGLSRRDVFPDAHYHSWWRKIWDRFFG